MSSIPLRTLPVIETFQPRISVMDDANESPQHPFRSKWVNVEGVPTCPQCGCHEFSVRDSEPWMNGAKPRYRVCDQCGLPAKTEEKFVD